MPPDSEHSHASLGSKSKHALACRLTPRAAGAIAVILVSGPASAEIVRRLLTADRLVDLAVGDVRKVRLLGAGQSIDDALLVRTARDQFELHVHGGVAVVDAVLAALAAAGAQVVGLGEIEGLLGGGVEEEVLMAMPEAATESALRGLLAQPAAWRTWAARWGGWLGELACGAPLWPLHAEVQWLLARSRRLRRLLRPARIAIVGPPNAGKSTLANALLGRPISITSDRAGTTRDWVDAHAILSAGAPPDILYAPVVLVDTAGVRETPDAIEQASIERTHRQARQADAILLVADATRAPERDQVALLESFGERPHVIACNKCDLLTGPLPREWAVHQPVPVSARTHAGLDRLMAAVLAQLGLYAEGACELSSCFAFSETRWEALEALALCDDPTACQELLRQLS